MRRKPTADTPALRRAMPASCRECPKKSLATRKAARYQPAITIAATMRIVPSENNCSLVECV
jgi:hypothetical protein